MMGIYLITNQVNGKVYVGQSVRIEERWSDHKRIAQNELKIQYPLYLAMRKYGIENFKLTILEECAQELLDEREIYWIKFYHSCVYDLNSNGYNITFGGSGNTQISPQQIQNMVELWNNGKSVGEISKITDINNHAVINYLKQYSNYTVEEGDLRGRINNGISHRKSINVYDNRCVFIKTCNGYQALVDEFNINLASISDVLNNTYSQYKGYYLIRSEQNQKEELYTRIKKQNPKQILLLNDDDSIDKLFFNKQEIKEFLSRDKIGSVQTCCEGRAKTAYKRKWMYLYNYINQHGFDYKWIPNLEERMNAVEYLNNF